jgi:hypothetical protein
MLLEHPDGTRKARAHGRALRTGAGGGGLEGVHFKMPPDPGQCWRPGRGFQGACKSCDYRSFSINSCTY